MSGTELDNVGSNATNATIIDAPNDENVVLFDANATNVTEISNNNTNIMTEAPTDIPRVIQDYDLSTDNHKPGKIPATVASAAVVHLLLVLIILKLRPWQMLPPKKYALSAKDRDRHMFVKLALLGGAFLAFLLTMVWTASCRLIYVGPSHLAKQERIGFGLFRAENEFNACRALVVDDPAQELVAGRVFAVMTCVLLGIAFLYIFLLNILPSCCCGGERSVKHETNYPLKRQRHCWIAALSMLYSAIWTTGYSFFVYDLNVCSSSLTWNCVRGAGRIPIYVIFLLLALILLGIWYIWDALMPRPITLEAQGDSYRMGDPFQSKRFDDDPESGAPVTPRSVSSSYSDKDIKLLTLTPQASKSPIRSPKSAPAGTMVVRTPRKGGKKQPQTQTPGRPEMPRSPRAGSRKAMLPGIPDLSNSSHHKSIQNAPPGRPGTPRRTGSKKKLLLTDGSGGDTQSAPGTPRRTGSKKLQLTDSPAPGTPRRTGSKKLQLTADGEDTTNSPAPGTPRRAGSKKKLAAAGGDTGSAPGTPRTPRRAGSKKLSSSGDSPASSIPSTPGPPNSPKRVSSVRRPGGKKKLPRRGSA